MIGLVWTIIAILVAFWIAGLILHFAGGFIWVALAVAAALLVFNLMTGRGARI